MQAWRVVMFVPFGEFSATSIALTSGRDTGGNTGSGRCEKSVGLLYSNRTMAEPLNPFDKLDRQELLWLAGILKDACRERLEKNLVSQEFENRLYQRGPVEGRLDPRPFLRIWEPRYRKFLEVATELHAMLEGEDAQLLAESLRAQFAQPVQITRHGPSRAKA